MAVASVITNDKGRVGDAGRDMEPAYRKYKIIV